MAQAYQSSPDYKAARIVGEKYATFRALVVDRLPE
jgi:hypothetical protein